MLRLSTPFRRMVYDLFSRLYSHAQWPWKGQSRTNLWLFALSIYTICVWPSHVFPHFCRHIPMPVCLNSLIFRDWKPKPLGYVWKTLSWLLKSLEISTFFFGPTHHRMFVTFTNIQIRRVTIWVSLVHLAQTSRIIERCVLKNDDQKKTKVLELFPHVFLWYTMNKQQVWTCSKNILWFIICLSND